VSLVVDLRIAHDRFGSSSDPSLNGHLHYPNDIDKSLNDPVSDKLLFAGLLDNHDRTHSPGSTGVWKPRSGCRLVRKNSRRGGEVRVGFRGNRKTLQVSGLDHKIGGVGMVSKSVSNTVHMVRITPIHRPKVSPGI
jgi:hypothetical protein